MQVTPIKRRSQISQSHLFINQSVKDHGLEYIWPVFKFYILNVSRPSHKVTKEGRIFFDRKNELGIFALIIHIPKNKNLSNDLPYHNLHKKCFVVLQKLSYSRI